MHPQRLEHLRRARVSSNFKLLDCMAFYVFSLDSFSVNFHHNLKHTSTIAFVLCSVSALFLPAMLEWSKGPWRWQFECVNIVSTNLFSTKLRTQERTRPQFQHHFWWPQNRCTGSLGASNLHCWLCGRSFLQWLKSVSGEQHYVRIHTNLELNCACK